MVVDFSAINYKERPMLVLKNLDGTYIQPLVYAHGIEASLYYNETSEIFFELPAYVDGIETPHYDDVVGMRIIDWTGIGQFILKDPKIINNGVKEVKACTAYSLEYELTYKQLFIEQGTYNFWNPVSPDGTVLGMILEHFPSWHVGTIDSDLIGRYRTFEVDNENAYNFIKQTLQESFQCIFDFDTYARTINARSVSSSVHASPVYLSLENLIKEIEITEDTENIRTCLDVNGADEVDIRSVNPLGTNKIYNLDYFMDTTYFSQSFIDKWNSWKSTYQNSQQLYFNLTIEKVLQEARLETEKAALVEMQGVLSQYETLRSTYVEAAAQGIDMSAELSEIKGKISEQISAIDEKEGLLAEIQSSVDSLLEQQKDINASCSFSAFFTDDERLLLDRYIREDSVADESFIYKTVSSYSVDDVAKSSSAVAINFENGLVTRITNTSGKEIYSIIGGTLSMTAGTEVTSASVVRGAIECGTTNSYIVTAYLGSGSTGGSDFPSGCISVTGADASLTTDVSPDPEVPGSYLEGTSVSISGGQSDLYFTQNATEYAKRSVEWDLFEYGQEILEDVAWPSYTFAIDSANFLADEDFQAFKNAFTLGTRVYLNFGNGKILTPIAIGAEFSPDDPQSFTLLFGDSYSSKDSAFKLVDLLEQSVSMGKTVSSKKNSFGSFVESGASSAVKDYMTEALDAAKQAILSSSGQAAQWDASGISLRKYVDGSSNSYQPEQMRIINNGLYLTKDGWETVSMAIGKLTTEDFGDQYGIVADLLVGKLIAGQNILIESSKQSGDTAVFRVDADGCRLYNSQFDLVNEYGNNQRGQISMYSPIGLVAGNVTASSPLFSYDENGNITGVMTQGGSEIADLSSFSSSDLPRAAFWLDMKGNAYFNGTVFASDGKFTGAVYATSGEFSGAIKAATLEGTLVGTNGGAIEGVSLNIGGGNFVVDGSGNVTMNGTINLSGGNITWGSNMPDTGLSEDEVITLIDEYGDKVPSWITSTYIASTEIKSPEITGNNIRALRAFTVGDGDGYMGYATGSKISDSGFGTVTTYGVALAASDVTTNTDGAITYSSSGHYLIVTDAGVRMQSNGHNITVTDNGAFYDGNPIGSGGTAVWG